MTIETILTSALVVFISGTIGVLVNNITRRFSPDAVEIGKKIARIAVRAVTGTLSKESLFSEAGFFNAIENFKILSRRKGIQYTDLQIKILILSEFYELRRENAVLDR